MLIHKGNQSEIAGTSSVQAHCGSDGPGDIYKTPSSPKMVPTNSNEFQSWLSGFLAASGNEGLTKEQVQVIKNKLATVSNYDWTYYPNDTRWNTFMQPCSSKPQVFC